MIYTLNQISNIDTALLYPYRILRTRSNMLNAMYKYSEPIAVQLNSYNKVQDIYEYTINCELNPNKIPYIEFINPDLLPELASMYEVETTDTGLIFRTKQLLTSPVDIYVYEVYSLQQIEQIMAEINEQLLSNDTTIKELTEIVDNLNISTSWAIDDTAKVPNLVMIDEKDSNKIFGDSNYMLSGALDKQLIVNPTQYELESMIKCITTQLTLQFLAKNNNIVEGFYGGLLTINSYNDTLVLRNCDAVINLEDLRVNTLIIDNCPYVFIKTTKSSINSTVSTVEVRHSNVLIDENIHIDRIMLSRRSTVNQLNSITDTLLLLEAGSTYYVDSITNTNKLNSVELKAIQGTLHIKGIEPYMHHRNIGFRKGQVEDPLPVSKLKVDITIRNSGGGSTPSGDWVDKVTTGEADIMTIYSALRACEWTKNAAIGALANMRHESNWITHMIGYNSIYFVSYTEPSSPDLLPYMNAAISGADLYNKIQATYDGHSADRAVGYGLTQFTSEPNISALYDYHTSTGLAYNTLGVQIPAFKQVLTQFELWDTMNAKTSPGEAAWYLCMYYEVPADRETQAAIRAQEATELAARYDFPD